MASEYPEVWHCTVTLEKTTLSGMIAAPDLIADVALILRAEHFREPAHRCVYLALQDAWQSGRGVSLPLLGERLREANTLQELGPQPYAWLGDLAGLDPTGANVLFHARKVREHAILRSLGIAAQNILASANEPLQPVEEILAEAERQVLAISELGVEGQLCSLAEALALVEQRIDRPGGGSLGRPTGLSDLDELTCGLQPGELIILAARPSCGKTALALAIARGVLERNPGCVYFASLEQSREELALRLICAEAGVDAQAIRKQTLTAADLSALVDAFGQLSKLPLQIDDQPSQRTLRIAAQARRLGRRPAGLALIVVDYLQLIEPDSREEARYEQVGVMTRRLKAIAREASVPLLCLAQLNRASVNRADPRPRLSDLRESGSIEADADTVLLLHPADDDPNRLTVIVAKQRNGPRGEFDLRFDRARLRFEEIVSGPFV